MNGLDQALLDKFNSMWTPEPFSGCHLWLGGMGGRGYGVFHRGTERVLAHRFSLETRIGVIPEGLLACHKCDVKLCVNPDHLFVGTSTDNMRDMVRKGRDRNGDENYGETHPCAKLREVDARYILASSASNGELATRFNVTKNAIRHIRIRKTWRHL